MRRVLDLPAAAVMPEPAAVLARIGTAGAASLGGDRTERLLAGALSILADASRPRTALREVSLEEFEEVYAGEGSNEPRTPVAEIYPRAGRLALFAVTLGPLPGERTEELFASRDFALGCVLDFAASEATELAADAVQRAWHERLAAVLPEARGWKLLRYCPGYCGWHIGAQRRLLSLLGAGEIGIRIRPSFLMEPLKSLSGVILAGPPEIHEFDDDYPFCSQCDERGCRERIRRP